MNLNGKALEAAAKAGDPEAWRESLPLHPDDRERLQSTATRIAIAAVTAYLSALTVTTVEELDKLVEGTQIMDQCERLTLEETSNQFLEWVDRHGNACSVMLPATIIATDGS